MPHLLSKTEDQFAGVRKSAFEVLEVLQVDALLKVAPELNSKLQNNDDDDDVRAGLVLLLCHLPGEILVELVPELLLGLDDESVEVRKSTLDALAL